MKNKLYVGNLPYSMTSDGLREAFAQFGEITDAKVITHRDSGRSKGFGFVEFASEESATAAIEAMHGQEVQGRKLVVNVARPFEPRQGQGMQDS